VILHVTYSFSSWRLRVQAILILLNVLSIELKIRFSCSSAFVKTIGLCSSSRWSTIKISINWASLQLDVKIIDIFWIINYKAMFQRFIKITDLYPLDRLNHEILAEHLRRVFHRKRRLQISSILSLHPQEKAKHIWKDIETKDVIKIIVIIMERKWPKEHILYFRWIVNMLKYMKYLWYWIHNWNQFQNYCNL